MSNQGWEYKTDLQLVEALRSEDQCDRDLAMMILHERYDSKLRRYFSRKLPYDWIEDTNQLTWFHFDKTVRVEGVRQGVVDLLMAIAHNKRVDAIRQIAKDRAIEERLPDEDSAKVGQIALSERSAEDEIIQEADYAQRELKLEFLRNVPFIPSLLTDCQRLAWLLHETMELEPQAVARLMGNNVQVIYSTLYEARRRVQGYLISPEFKIDTAFREVMDSAFMSSFTPEPGYNPPFLCQIADRFAAQINPRLSTEEWKALDLTPDDVLANYVVSIEVTRVHKVPVNPAQVHTQLVEAFALQLVLVEKEKWPRQVEYMKLLQRIERGQDQVEALGESGNLQTERVVWIGNDDGNILLEPRGSRIIAPGPFRQTLSEAPFNRLPFPVPVYYDAWHIGWRTPRIFAPTHHFNDVDPAINVAP